LPYLGICTGIAGVHATIYLRVNYDVLVKFFDAAAAAGDGVILWLS